MPLFTLVSITAGCSTTAIVSGLQPAKQLPSQNIAASVSHKCLVGEGLCCINRILMIHFNYIKIPINSHRIKYHNRGSSINLKKNVGVCRNVKSNPHNIFVRHRAFHSKSSSPPLRYGSCGLSISIPNVVRKSQLIYTAP